MSIQTGNLKNVTYLRLDQIRRPIVPVLDEPKITRMMETLKNSDPEDLDDGLPPIDILCVRKDGEPWYFGFGGCHRFQAYDRLGKKMVKCKIVPMTESMLKLYVGGSVTEMFKERPAAAAAE
ncbi:ParB/Sulfiredoxin [Dipodascopsis tothii]|uniref:ParB/Sulfiredoxin n=1 Tax=Dipodascopsis tothii TaxID=44089 RepID=UPI0034CDAD20